ncbi:N-acetylmuramoyl-L-alanine amidase [Cytobacillus solani]|uniref:N-acetylmuramoyl-L-alanine amidase n=1 Tax=Cytobacillus solani TaxID=1637975 RepID=A0A0Q3QT70_9BACI|nr:N-acetylmuramoyl-L-alanine amidase [Cytobacillus solani]KOP71993.1 N-acetylmuramoyl-L-alanine amidase [Bacillus sp. FJAT-21945]KQL21345.1 N-acetylmuramoyl-L-alanine amidase [Cytobacillus solani]USK54634.1 N-acetylmuramoyl-L-alanine amidase [Cytobacillus solani]
MKKLIASSVLATAALFPAIVQAESLDTPANTLVEQINSSMIQTGKNALITENNVNIRKGATTSYQVVTKLSKNTVVKVIDSFTNSKGELWYRIELGSVKGWVIQDYVAPSNDYKPAPPSTEVKTIYAAKAPVRKGATDSYSIVTYVYQNQKVNIIDTFKNAAGETWYRADLGSVKGWIHGDAFDSTANPPSPPGSETTDLPDIGSYVYSGQNGLDVRKGATTSYASVYKLSLNQKVKVIDHFTHTDGTAWLRVEVNASLAGWIPAESVSTSESLNLDLYVTADVANLRSGPSTSYSIMDQATKGTLLKAVKSEKGSDGHLWYQVLTSSNQLAWISETIVSTQTTNTYAVGSKYTVSTSNTNLRSGASTQYKVVEVLKKNTTITILGEFKNSLGQQWINILSSSGKKGWVLSSDMASFQLVSKKLLSPTVTTSGGDQYLNWKKASNFSVSYTTLSSNRLKLTGGLTDVELPSGKIPGIQSVETFASGAEKSVVITFEPGYSFTMRNYNDKLSIKIVPFGMKGKTIIVDAGHGGKDSGAVGPSGIKEKDVVLATALALKEEIEKYGATVILTRSTDVFLELAERTAIANKSTADAFISVHADSFSASSNGSTTYYNSTVNFNGPRSKTLGSAVQKSMISSLSTYNRGVKEQNFYVNRMNDLPSILVELAFISNPKEEKLLNSSDFRKKAAVGITNGLEEYFNNF